MFSMAGIPPLIGFFAKLGVFLALVKTGFYSVEFYLVALISFLCSVISTFYYIRIVKILHFENIIVGKLYYPIETDNTIFLGLLLFLLLFLFINPTLLYLITYKVGFLFLPIVPSY
jgi:NADH-quinone oxidoreductase subunit N